MAVALGCALPAPVDVPAPSIALRDQGRARAHALGIHIGALPAGVHDAITDVPGVAVGHATLHEGERLHTGVTVILPHGPGSNPFRDRCNAAVVVQNGFGKLIGSTQVNELGELEAPIALCGTLNVFRVADGLLDWLLTLPGNEDVRSANVVVGETNDGRLSDIRSRPLGSEHVRAAIAAATTGEVPVGAVGAGAGTVAFGWKGGIGTASRVVDGHTVGVLVQSNFGGRLVIAGVPVHEQLRPEDHGAADRDGSCMIVIATDAPLDAAALRRLAARAFAGMARCGASFSNGSGDYAIAFSTAARDATWRRGDALSPLFVAVADATEQAIVDSLCAAQTTTGMGRTVPALPLQPLREVLASRAR
ncbi:MAG: P1 family peptidase [Planctomycetes bacterium]|nr:P1 family peptidase [Planctomycetota bacterium]